MMFVGNQHFDVQNELNICEFENEDAPKRTSASADPRINFSLMMMSLWVRIWCSCLVLLNIFLSVSPSPSLVTMSLKKSIGVSRVNKWTRKPVYQRRENC